MVSALPGSPLAGRFVAFEGGDGSGKSTHLSLLVGELRRRGLVDAPGRPAAVVTREPGGTELGAAIRQLLLRGAGQDGDMAAVTEALLYAADRAEHVARVIRPALARGDLVLSDRYLDSSIAYQVEGRGLAQGLVERVNRLATGGLTPDLTILLDIDPAAAAARLESSGGQADRLESAGGDFHSRVNQRYRDLAAAEPGRYAVLAAEAPLAELGQRVWQVFEGFMAGWGGAG
jgi:dTMP kinase